MKNIFKELNKTVVLTKEAFRSGVRLSGAYPFPITNINVIENGETYELPVIFNSDILRIATGLPFGGAVSVRKEIIIDDDFEKVAYDPESYPQLHNVFLFILYHELGHIAHFKQEGLGDVKGIFSSIKKTFFGRKISFEMANDIYGIQQGVISPQDVVDGLNYLRDGICSVVAFAESSTAVKEIDVRISYVKVRYGI